jgi:phenylacetate-CoA ligase
MMENNKAFLKFNKLLNFVFENKQSDFYRLKYKQAGFNPVTDFKSIKDVKKIPLLTKEELTSADPMKLLFIEKEKVEIISATSGTSGEPFITFRSFQSSDHLGPLKAVDFGKCLFLASPIRTHATSYLWARRGRWVLAGDIHNIPASLQLASRFGINTIYTTPTLAIILKDYIERYPKLKESLRFFWLGGESVSPAKKSILQKLYPKLLFFLGYGISETGGLSVGFQCLSLAKRNDQIYFHPRMDEFYYEILNPDTEQEAKEGESGELILTAFFNPATPVIRYKTGDLVSLKKNDCPCGYSGPLLQVLGRSAHDTVRAGGVELRKEAIEKPLLNLKDYLKESFEAHIYENLVGGKLKIKVLLKLSLKKDVRESLELRRKIEKEILEKWQLSPRLNLKKAVEGGLFDPLQINFVQFPLAAKARQVLVLHQSL